MNQIESAADISPALPVDAATIEAELARIWREAHLALGDGTRNLKIALSNLLVLTPPTRRADADRIIRQYAFKRPSRVIEIVVNNEMTEPPHAHIAASCNLSAGLREKLCWEKITVEAKSTDMNGLIGLVRSLLLGGEIPLVVVDLYGLKREVDLRQRIYRLADFIFVDGRGRFHNLLPPPGSFDDQMIYGFDWVSVDAMREAVRSQFDSPQILTRLAGLKRISLTSGPTANGPSSSALLLAGWVVASLDLEIESVVGHEIWLTTKAGERVALEFTVDNAESESDLSLVLHFKNAEESLSFKRYPNGVEIAHGGRLYCHAPRKPFDAAAFVVEQSSKDRYRSSYAASYRAAEALYNRLQGLAGRRAMIVLSDTNRLARVTSRLFYRLAIRTLAYQQKFYVALAGGTTPKMVYREIVASPYVNAVDWDQVYFFFGDERAVGPDHSDSNYKLAYDYLLGPLGIKPHNVFRIEGENHAYKQVCKNYAETIMSILPKNHLGRPRFDLIFLGVGEDGHTASLFPEIEFEKLNQDYLIVHQFFRKLEQHRISFNLSLINSAAHIFFVVSGEQKAAALQSVFFPERSAVVPAARVRPDDGRVLWLVDDAATAQLSGTTLPFEVSRW
jgi:6-phosphogluconolactonase